MSGAAGWREFHLFFRLPRVIAAFRPDVIWSAVWYPAAVIASYLPSALSYPEFVSAYGSEIFVCSDHWKRRLKAMMGPWKRRVFDKCSRIFPLSAYTRKELLKIGAPASKMTIVGGGVAEAAFSKSAPGRVKSQPVV